MTSSRKSPFIGVNEFYVFCPGGVVTGGPELLHQLVAEMIALGIDAKISYYPVGRPFETPDEYRRYDCPVSHTVPDRCDIGVIFPEVATDLLPAFFQARTAVWWLSVDNYFGRLFSRRYVKNRLGAAVGRYPRQLKYAIHLFQSKYAENFLKKNLKLDGFMLTDYLSDELRLVATSSDKNNSVVYNPRKDNFTKHALKRFAPHICFLPIENMTRRDVRNALESAKIYVDFGPHPGKDRMPREAALAGCVVITGQRGSAANDEDVPLQIPYKISKPWLKMHQIITLINEINNNYLTHFRRQEEFRAAILNERKTFTKQVRDLFVF